MRRAQFILFPLLVLAVSGPASAQGTGPGPAPPAGAPPQSDQQPFSLAPQPIVPPHGSEAVRPAPFPPVSPAGEPLSPAAAAPPVDPPPAAAVAAPTPPSQPDVPMTPAIAAPQPAPPAPAATAAPAVPPTTPAPPQATASEPDPLPAAILAELERSRPSARQGRDWQTAIQAFYRARDGKPVWMSRTGITPTGEALVAEIGRADEWGLDPRAFDASGMPGAGAPPDALAAAELQLARAVLGYAWHARGGRVDPSQLSKWLDQSPRPLDAKATLEFLAASSDPSIALQKLHPQHPQFELLRQAYLKFRSGQAPAQAADPKDVVIPAGPQIKIGQSHPHIALLRRRLSVPAATAEDESVYDQALAGAVREFLGVRYRDRQTGRWVERAAFPPLTNGVRTSLNGQAKKVAAPRGPTLKQFIVNLERWRWLPEDLGAKHVWNNLPEYQTRVMSEGQVIHQERIIIGKPTNQTPVFSDSMQFVVFHPDWGVPGTIKVQDLKPALQAGDASILARRNMRIVSGNRTVHPDEIDWERTDIRNLAVIQDPGPDNPLGLMKFMFPNKHDVYMHDTPTKNLFNQSTRALSFGCIRVRNPQRLAEIVFGHDRNWGRTEVASLIQSRAQPNNRVNLNRRIPVHNTYFTLLADKDGQVSAFADVYGHDRRIQAVLLDGQRVEVVAQSDPALALERKVKELAEAPPPPRREQDGFGWGGFGWGQPQDPRGRRPMPNNPFDGFFTGLFGN